MTERAPYPDEIRGWATAIETLGWQEKAKPDLIRLLRAAADALEHSKSWHCQEREALLMAQRVLRRWSELYAEWSNANGHMEALMDRRLPPADHVKALEAIAAALSEPPKPGAVCTDPECCYHGQRKASSCVCSSAGESPDPGAEGRV